MAIDISRCQRDIDTICSVSSSWGLSLNPDKCVVLRFQCGTVVWKDIGPLQSYSLYSVNLKFVEAHKDLGITIDTSLRFHQHIRTVVNKAAAVSSNLLRSTLCRSPNFMMTLYKSHIRPLLEFGSPVWNTGYISDLRLLESVQRRWTKQMEGMSELSYSERLAVLNLYSVKGRLLRADMIKCWTRLHHKSSIHPEDLLALAPAVGTCGHRFKLANSFIY